MDHDASFDASEDRRLVVRLTQGDDTAFTEIIERYYTNLLTYLTHATGSQASAEDLLQDVFLRAWRVRQSLPTAGSLRPYLYRAARNALLDRGRSKQRAARAYDAYAQEQRDAHDAQGADTLEQDELAAAVRAAMEALPERVREVLLLQRDHGLSYKEIADVLGISVHTVKFHIGRAIAMIRSAVGPLLGALLVARW